MRASYTLEAQENKSVGERIEEKEMDLRPKSPADFPAPVVSVE